MRAGLFIFILGLSSPVSAQEFSVEAVTTAELKFSQFQLSFMGSGMGSDQISQFGLLSTYRFSPWIGVNIGALGSRFRVATQKLSTSSAGDYLMNVPMTLALFRPLNGPNMLELSIGTSILADVRMSAGGGTTMLALIGIGYRLWPADGGFHMKAGFDYMTDFGELAFSGAHLAMGYAF